ncbi:MAG: thiamine-phosphate kinase [Bacteroidota bacterium]|nr:thiamine-phosphate kinase [Bacteroidota bacterium]
MAEKKENRTELSELGEFGLIEHLTKNINIKGPGTIKGVGDDAAVIDTKDKLVLVSTDLLIEGVHFDMTYTPLKHLGYKAAVVNFSDIIAMNGVPTQMTVSISVSNRYSLEALEELYSGLLLACEKYNVDLVGGDTTTSLSGLYISVTALGEAEKNKIVYRDTAKKDDLICVSGDLGGAYMGLMILEREKQAFKADPDMQPDLQGYDYVIERQLKPEARQDILKILAGIDVQPTAMIDISDGLASDIMHICKNSKLGCKLYEDKLPVNQDVMKAAMDFNISSATAALNGGEDYELLITIAQDDYEKVKDVMGISVIGHMTDQSEGMNLVTDTGEQIELKAQGWDSLRK